MLKSNKTSFCDVQDQMKAGFLISDCVSVEVRGPSRAYHSSMPFTQGTVTAISNDQHQGYYWEVQVSVSYVKCTSPGPTQSHCLDSASHQSRQIKGRGLLSTSLSSTLRSIMTLGQKTVEHGKQYGLMRFDVL